MPSLISILLPVKNAGAYLEECLHSILQQSETNWELIAIDDHAEDDSFAILKAFANSDPRIKVFKNDGKGIIPALRKAYSMSKGQLITRMDADDIMAVDKLEQLKTILIRQGPGHLASGLVKYFAANALGRGYKKYQDWLNDLSLSQNNFQDIYKECVIPSPCWMVYRGDLDKCGAFDPDIYPEDYDLCFRFYKMRLKVKTVPKVLHHWRDYTERTSRNDPRYSDVHFFDLKITYFLKTDYDPKRSLVLWGAGSKGKQLAKVFKNLNIPFRWLTDNPQKIDHFIYETKLETTACLPSITHPQIIIAIAAPDALPGIQNTLDQLNLEKASDYFFFC